MLQQFFVTFGMDPMTDMTEGRKYLVTFNGADLTGYQGQDDIGDTFCMSANLFEPLAPSTPWVNSMIVPIDKPSDDLDYTHMGNYKGPKGHRFTTGGNYNLIYEDATDSVSVRDDAGKWKQVDGAYFDVTHNYSRGGGIPNVPSAGNAAHNPTASDILGGQAAAPQVVRDMTGITITNADDMYTPEQEETIALWTEDGDPALPAGPASTEDLRQYRFKPDLF